MLQIDIVDYSLIIIDSSFELKPNQAGQLYFWGFKKNNIGNSYQLRSSGSMEEIDSKILKVLSYFDKESVPYTLSKACREYLSILRDKRNSMERIKKLAKSFKEGDFDRGQFNKFISTISEIVPRKLKDHQLKAAYHHYLAENAANFSVPGSGKTSVVLSVYEKLKTEGEVNVLFVVGPVACFGPWKKEFEYTLGRKPDYMIFAGGEQNLRRSEYFSPNSNRYELYLTTYQTLVNDQNEVTRFFQRKGMKALLTIDEAHYIKQIGGIWSNAILNIAKFAKYRCVLTGTPIPKSYKDMFNLFDFLWLRNSPLDSEIKTKITIYDGERNSASAKKLLSENIGPFFYRVRKSELGLIPPIYHPPYILRMNKFEALVYKTIIEKITSYAKEDYLKNIDVVVKLRRGRIIRLRQCVSYVRLLFTAIDNYNENVLGDKSDIGQIINDYDRLEIPAKLEYLKKIVINLQQRNQKVVIWSHFIMTLELIVSYLKKEGLNCKLIYGKTPIEQTSIEEEETREIIRDEFIDPKSGLDILVANPAACGESVSLHKTCFNAIYYDLSYNCAQYLQSLDRIHRVGGSETNQAYYHFLQYKDTVDQDIKANVDRKAQNMYDIIEEDYNIYSIDMFEEDDDSEAYKRLFLKSNVPI